MGAGSYLGSLKSRSGVVLAVIAAVSLMAAGASPGFLSRLPVARGDAPADVTVQAVGEEPSPIRCETCGVIERVERVEPSQDMVRIRSPQSELTRQHLWEQGRMTLAVLGAVGGIHLGDQGERAMRNSRTSYRISVLMADGSRDIVYSSAAPSVSVGDRVRIEAGVLLDVAS